MQVFGFLHQCVTGAVLFLFSFTCAYANEVPPAENDSGDSSFNTPIVTLNTYNSSAYGFFANAEYTNTWSENNAASFLLGFGVNTFRIGIVWAHQLTDNQRLKLGIEHFAQEIQFDFVSSPDHEYIGQNAIGATYQYLFHNSILQQLNVSGYYSGSKNGVFKDRPFNTPMGGMVDVRGVAGANSEGVNAGPQFHLWRGASLSTAVSYDAVAYGVHYEPAKDVHGLGVIASFEQQLPHHSQLNLSAAKLKPYDLYQVSVDWPAYATAVRRLDLGISGSHLQSDILPVADDNIVGLTLVYRWDGAVDLNRNDATSQLLDWARSSPAYLPEVYAMRDETVVPPPPS